MTIQPSTELKRQLSFLDAVVIGMTSMIGSGIFVAIVPATIVAGSGILIGIILAGFVAYCNALSSAQLAAVYPESGGTYVYGRKQLGPFWGWIAGWIFVVGKIASCATAALAFGYYVAPSVAKILAMIAVIVLASVNYFGIEKSVRVSWAIAAAVILSLLTVIYSTLSGGAADAINLGTLALKGGVFGVLQSAGLMFFAFTGYARIATLGGEVQEPQRTIPLAIITSLGVTLVIYLAVTAAVLSVLGPGYVFLSQAPLTDAVSASGFFALVPVVQMGATVATLGVLLSLLLGISRTIFAMASYGDLSSWFSAIHPRYQVPQRAEIFVAIVVIIIIYFGKITSVMALSSFAILVYYAITNICALKLPKEKRLWPQLLSVLGFVFCILLALSLPLLSIIQGIAVILCAMIGYLIKKSLLKR